MGPVVVPLAPRWSLLMIARQWSIQAAAILLACTAQRAHAQKSAPCYGIGSTAFTLSRTGGNIKPETVELRADGQVTIVDQAASPPASRQRTVSPDAMAGLARLAWSGGFAALRSGPQRAANKDAAHQAIEVRSAACGRQRVEWVGDGAPPQFRELWALLVLASDAVP